ncbi:MAG: NAD(+) synthase [Rectinemataceae bacterium]
MLILSNIMIALTKDLLKIDAEETTGIICDFIKEKHAELGRDAIVVPISGGLDSSVVAALCVRAVGKDKVVGLMLPERQGNPEAGRFAKQLAAALGIQTRKISITNALFALGTYGFVLSFFPTKKLRDSVALKYMKSSGENMLLDSIRGSKSRLNRAATASINSKQRMRALVMCKFADENNYLTVGSAHLTEDMVGLFVKFGIDDVADLMPMKGLFRMQILQIAEYLGVPESITGRTPNPDVIPGVHDKYLGMLGLPADTVDLVLCGILHGLTNQEIAEQLFIDRKKVEEVRELVRLSDHMRHPSQAPELVNPAVPPAMA